MLGGFEHCGQLERVRRFIEFYNLVFMESNRAPDGAVTPLASRNIDTGMGLERMAQILQARSIACTTLRRAQLNAHNSIAMLPCTSAQPPWQRCKWFLWCHKLAVMEGGLEHASTKTDGVQLTKHWLASALQGVSNNYETDLLRPVMDAAAELAGISYDTADEKSRTSLKVLRVAALSLCMPPLWHVACQNPPKLSLITGGSKSSQGPTEPRANAVPADSCRGQPHCII